MSHSMKNSHPKRSSCKWWNLLWGSPMSLRFYPGGTEGVEEGDDPMVDDSKVKADAEARKEYTREQQRADQEAANARRARDEAQQYKSQLESMQQEQASLQGKLEELQAKAEDRDLPNLDPEQFEGSDRTLVEAIKALEIQLKHSNQKIGKLEKTKDDLLAERREQESRDARSRNYNELLEDLDEEYGAQYRNDAVKAFTTLAKKGEVPQNNSAKAARLMEKCYKQAVKDAAEKKGKGGEDILRDTGAGGGGPSMGGTLKLKPGSLEEVSAQITKKMGKPG